jgi:long-subunit acyl-CoA synthetase (AMP-forming)
MLGKATVCHKICKSKMTAFLGLTEISMAGYLPNTAIEEFNACGYLVPTLEMKIIDIQTGNALPPGKRGEVCFRGPTVFKGYLNRPRATAETIDSEGWLHTGNFYNISNYFN